LSKVTNPDPRSLAAIKAKRKWMKGKISDKDLDAAESAAWAAARSAAWAEFDTLLTQMVETKRKYHGKRKTHDGYIEN